MPDNNFIYQDHYVLANGAVSANTPLSGDGSNASPLGIQAQYISAWGTETMPISACDGVKLVPSDGIIYAKLDETVLYTATAASNTITLSEKCTNFERLRLELKSYQSPTVINYTEVKPDNTTLTFFAQTLIPAATYPLQILGVQFTGTNGITYNMNKGVRFFYKNNDHGGNESNDMTSNIKDAGFITKIVGINRLSGTV